jgi:outer membrane protein assembly factor BamB
MRTAAVLLLAVSAAARADDWPQWFGPQRDGVWREDGILDTFPTGGPKLKWRAPVGMGYAGPAVAAGKVFVPDRQLATGSANPANPFDSKAIPGNERVACFDAATGAQLWKHEYPCEYRISYAAGPRCTPAVDADRVYALGAMGDLVCLRVADGSVVWSKNLPAEYAAKVPVWGYAGHPLIDGDKLIVVAGGSNDRLVVAFDKLTGKQVWASQSCEGDFGYGAPVVFTFGGRRQVVVWHTRAVVGLDPDTGKRLWAVPFDVKFALTAPTPRQVGADGLFVTSFYNGSMLLKVSADSAGVVWKSKAKGEKPSQTTDLSSIMGTPAVDGDHLYGGCSYGEFRCLKAATGERVWKTMAVTRGALTPPAVAAEPEPTDGERWANVFVVPHRGRHFLFNEQGDLILAKLTPAGYAELGRAHLLDPTGSAQKRKVVWTHPAFAGRCVFARNDNELVCYDLSK